MRRPRPRLSLTIQYAAPGNDLPARPLLRRWVAAALETDALVTLRFVDAREARTLNRTYRGRDYATNVLSFVYDDESGALRGDVALCGPVLRREAATQGKSLAAHCAHLVVHGMLHLQGYDHERTADAARMETREAAILARLGFADPYAARPRTARRDSQ
jgi:probable rRNA maturation factor